MTCTALTRPSGFARLLLTMSVLGRLSFSWPVRTVDMIMSARRLKEGKEPLTDHLELRLHI